MKRSILLACLCSFAIPTFATAQVAVVNGRRTSRPVRFRIQEVEVQATLKDQAANVQMAQVFHNQSSFTVEAQFLFPMPEGAAISGLTLIVDGKELTGELKKKDKARQVYESIVRRQRDPALLEYVGDNVFKTSVFPIPAGQKRRVEIRYTQLLEKDSGLVDFTLPLGTFKHSQQPIEKTTVRVRLDTTNALKTVYSPTHKFTIKRPEENRARCELVLNNVLRPDDVRLLYGTRGGAVGMNLLSYRPDPDKDGYFLLLASPRVKAKKGAVIPKTVVFVVDKSGSMSGQKIDQAKASLKYMINKLGEKDTFNIIAYSTEVESFREELELVNDKTRSAALAYVDDIYSGGGTNINDALTAALKQLKDKSRPSYVMFLTDGMPTVGVQDEKLIAANAKKVNAVSSRVFSFGVGYDVNSRLLDRLSRDNRGTSIYVKPNEDIEVASTNLFRKVSSPAMTGIAVQIAPQKHDSERKAVRRVYPSELPDLFRGEQLVVVGRYRTSGSTKVVMKGQVNGKDKFHELEAKLVSKSNTGSNSYIEKLWVTRRIGEIIDQLDLNGRNQELIDELVALSLRHGIMTPYTSFLADENVQLANTTRNRAATGQMLERLEMSSGEGGFAQRRLKKSLQNASTLPPAEIADSESLGRSFGGGGGVGGGGLGGRRSRGGGRADSATPSRGSAQSGKQEGKEKSQPGYGPRERIRRIGAKTFYWKKEKWVDADFGDTAKDTKAKVIEIEQYSKEYFELAAKDKGKYSKFLTLKEPVEVVLDKVRYRILPPKKTAK